MYDPEVLTDEQILAAVVAEIKWQDQVSTNIPRTRDEVRLAIASLQDEVREVWEAWHLWKRQPDWSAVRDEAIQTAALAYRLARVPVGLVD